ncbi:MAG: hypothetical protein WC858_01160 [Parcubacteria group bacterium]|jgi:hypothetical protein
MAAEKTPGGRILTMDLIYKAIGLAEPTATAILKQRGATWGPKQVFGFATGPDIEHPVSFHFSADEDGIWKRDWGTPERFVNIAAKKLKVALREKSPTSVVIAARPWSLDPGEFLYTGGFYRDGLAASASGAKGFADAAIAEILISNIVMLCQLEAGRRIEAGQTEI